MTAPLLDRLQELAAEAHRDGRVVKVLLSGDAGAGRSHAVAHLAEALRTRGFTCLCASLRDGPAAAAVLRALAPELPEGRAALVEALAASALLEGREPVERRLAAELLASLLGVVEPDFGTAGLDPESRREGAFAELGRWLTSQAARAPVLLALDDAHLAEGDSAALVDFLGNLGGALPLLLLVTAEGPGPPDGGRLEAWRTEPGWVRLEVPRAPDEVIAQLIAAHALPADVAATVRARAGGTPGLALALADFARGAPGRALPTTAAELRLTAVRTLGPEAFGLARRAAELGDEVPEAALRATGDVPESALEALAGAAVLRRFSSGGEPRLRFVDARTRAALASDLAPDEATRTRRAAAQWAVAALEAAGPLRFADVAPLVPLALPALSDVDASLWSEAHAAVLSDRQRTLAALTTAAGSALGTRRLVLLRRIADLQVLSGQPERALETLKVAGRFAPPASPLPANSPARVVAALVRPPLDRWHELPPEAALAAAELTRAEALSHLVRKDETRQAFTELEKRLARLSGLVGATLWVRWAKAWSWFLCEILRRPQEALRACQAVRRAVPADFLRGGELALGLVRAEEVAASSAGDFSAARTHVEEHLRLAHAANNLREGCLAWNARGNLHFGQGELPQARRAFEKAIEQARATGWLRRDAISTHNLALVLTELGEWDAAHTAETRYAALSVTIGNHAGTAEAPAVLAGVALGRGDLPAAEAAIAQATKAAESNGWTMLLAWARALSARARVLRWQKSRDSLDLTRARGDGLAALDALEEASTAWAEELDPGEVYALHAAVQKLEGQRDAARRTLERARRLVPAENVVSHRALDVGGAFVDGQGLADALAWFDARGYVRLARWWRSLAT